MSEFQLSIVVPVYNEAENLPALLPILVSACKENDWQAVFVNDGSVDNSSTLLLQAAEQHSFIKVVEHKINKGYGRALKSGIKAAAAPYLVTFDGDGQHQIADVSAIYAFALQEDADMVVGKRTLSAKENPYRKTGKWIIRKFANFLVPLPIQDLNSGFKLYKTELARRYSLICPDSMAFSDVITLTFVSRRDKVLEYPITVHPREKGTSTINFYTAVDTIWEILSIVMLFNPMKIFGLLSLIMIFAGALWGFPFLLMGRGLTVTALLLFMMGALFFTIGLLASQLSAIRLASLEKDD